MVLTLHIGWLQCQEVGNPEALAGRWETADGQGGQVGMNILISTSVASTVKDLHGARQRLEAFEIGLFHRSGADVKQPGFAYFTTSAQGGATWDGRRLRIESRALAGNPAVHVDLTWNSVAKTWTGLYDRPPFRRELVTLSRPAWHERSPLAGTWLALSDGGNNCVHIAQAQDGTFTGWSDQIQVPGRMRYAPTIKPPERIFEQYGVIATVKRAAADRVDVVLWAYTSACCPHPFSATLSQGGRYLLGDLPGGANQSSHRERWRRVPTDSCTAAAGQPESATVQN